MDYDLVIAGGKVVSGSGTTKADVAIRDGKVAAVGSHLHGRERIDASSLLVLPGVIDAHTHFRLAASGMVSADDFESGSRAAALGGVTTFLDFTAPAAPGALAEAVAARRAEADERVSVDYSLHATLAGWDATGEEAMRALVKSGIPTFKMFTAYRAQGWRSSDGDLFSALRDSARSGAMVMVHAENEELIGFFQREASERGWTGAPAHARTRPPIVEAEAIARAILFARETGGRLYIVHVSSAAGLERVREGREQRANVHAETCPQYLLLDDSLFERSDGHRFATCPPIRAREDAERLWEGLARGALDVVATDHCVFDGGQKAAWGGDYRKIPMGLPGVELLLPLLYTAGVNGGRFPVEHLVRMLSENPARLFGLWPRKGAIQAGFDADIVLFDPSLEVTVDHERLAMPCDYSPYDGFRATGWPVTTFLRGTAVVRERRFVGFPGQGRFLAREPLGETA
ncbi:MAG: dihydropyrimidinase [Candidatus Eisenbacteria bacterium]|nr:dihydropyrimidinase [Candidatus Eisenbacteria bacterium]